MITRTFKLCLNAGTGSAPFINVSQTDKDEVWLFELYTETGERYIPSSGAIIGIKADGHGIANTGTVDSEGRVVITETEQMTAAAGRSIFELSIDGLTHGTANFIVNVEKKPIDGAIMSDSDLSLISQAVDSAAVIVDVIGDGDPSEVIGEHVDAWLDNHPEATTTVLDGAITAPKINQSLWDKLLVSEEASGAVASFDDGADDVPVSSLKVALEPIQLGSGDPSPSNIRPIVAANGINVWDEQWEVGAYSSIDGSKATVTDRIRSKNFIPVKPSTTYYTTKILQVYFYGENYNYINWTTSSQNWFTTPSNCSYATFNGMANSGTTYNHDISINYPSSYTAYQPYQGIMVERTGKNLLPPFVVNASWEGGNATVVGTGDGAYIFNGTTTGYQQSVIQSDIYLKAGTYTFGVTVEASGTPVPVNVQLRNVSGGVTYATASWTTPKQAFTLTEDTTVRMRFVVPSAVTLNNVIFKPQIEYGSEATEFEPYTGNTYPCTLGQSVYGGTVDLATGVLTVDKAMVDLGTLSWTAHSHATFGQYFYANVSPLGIKYEGSYVSTVYTALCTSYAIAKRESASFVDKTCCFDGAVNQVTQVQIKDATYSDAATFKTAMNGVQLVYKLATPQTIQLTPTEVKTLLGYNNISSTGTVDVIYHADTKLYVDKMTNVDNNIIAPTEEGFTATRNYTVNDLVIVNDTLYKVTANIASGSAITPNSNVTATTLGALIKALS